MVIFMNAASYMILHTYWWEVCNDWMKLMGKTGKRVYLHNCENCDSQGYGRISKHWSEPALLGFEMLMKAREREPLNQLERMGLRRLGSTRQHCSPWKGVTVFPMQPIRAFQERWNGVSNTEWYQLVKAP